MPPQNNEKYVCFKCNLFYFPLMQYSLVANGKAYWSIIFISLYPLSSSIIFLHLRTFHLENKLIWKKSLRRSRPCSSSSNQQRRRDNTLLPSLVQFRFGDQEAPTEVHQEVVRVSVLLPSLLQKG